MDNTKPLVQDGNNERLSPGEDGRNNLNISITMPSHNNINGSTPHGLVNIIRESPVPLAPISPTPITGQQHNSQGSGVGGGGGLGVQRVTSMRRPQGQQIPAPAFDQKFLTLTIHKDSTGYGMKVSGDNPVYVDSVKTGGAAHKAGVIAGDMILKVNGIEVRYEKHPTVVALIKSNLVVELTVRRSTKMQRPSSVGIGPGTPILSRDRTTSITGPQPVNNDKQKEYEFQKIKTLQLMLEQEKKNLENILKTSSNANRPDRVRAEANIRKLQEELRQVGGEELIFVQKSSHLTPQISQIQLNTPTQQHSSPAFLSRFPRSLSSLSLGTRKQKEKELHQIPINTLISPIDLLASQQQQHQLTTSQSMSQSMYQKYQPSPFLLTPTTPNLPSQSKQTIVESLTPTKTQQSKQKHPSQHNKEDIPPPLPQRNPPRFVSTTPTTDSSGGLSSDWRNRNVPVSDLDLSMGQSSKRYSPNSNRNSPTSGKIEASSKKRSKQKTKALSDPKMSTQLFLQMEKGGITEDGQDLSIPPPLPPRQAGMLEENQVGAKRSAPNSVDTLMNYPLVSTCTAVRGGNLDLPPSSAAAAFPLSQRPNIVQQLKQHQQHIQQLQQSKSSALGPAPPNHYNNKHRRVVSSPENTNAKQEKQLDRLNKSSSGSWELQEKENEITPPGTPPPPYPSSNLIHGSHISQLGGSEETDHHFFEQATGITSPIHNFPNQILAAQPNLIQKEIISMEDEDVSDQECIIDEHGPFNYLQRLLEPHHITHLAVFLNYVLSNSDPAPLLFYLITGLYKDGTAKDMRKWAYEIHSTFLVPCAPLQFTSDESLAREIDNVLQNEYDKAEILRKVFLKSRKKAKERICDQLIDFQQKRTAGLGTIYGPNDAQLAEAKGDKAKEQKIFEETLLKKLQIMVDEKDREETFFEESKKAALCSALSTVLQRIFITRSNPGSPIDRVNHFVCREKSFKKYMGKHRKIVVRGHPLTLRQYYEVTHCNHCQNIIWGVSPQGYHCTDCKLNIHRPCKDILEENCPGPLPQKRKEQNSDNKIRNFMGKIRTNHNFIQNERRARLEEENINEDIFNGERLQSPSVQRQPSDRRSDSGNTSVNSSNANTSIQHNTSDLLKSTLENEANARDADTEISRRGKRHESKSAPVSVNRSESYKDRINQKKIRKTRRKTSDPLSLTKTNDEQSDAGISNTNYTASSSSSLSSGGSIDSPSASLAQLNSTTTGQHFPISQSHHQHHQNNQSNTTGSLNTSGGNVPTRQWIDSEDEDDFNEVDWSSNIAADILINLSDHEKKRQEIINEIFQTERSHIRTLRLLEKIFYLPLRDCGYLPHEDLHLLFPPALLHLKNLHNTFESKLKQLRLDHSYIVKNVGDLLVEMFDGQSGEELKYHAGQFCARQQIALEALKEKRRKDENLQRFLSKAESHKACRRLQLKDLLPTVLHRLTKYPLFFENLLKVTKRVAPDDFDEAEKIKKALDSSKRILIDVNQAVKLSEDTHKLQTIQRKLDRSSFDKDPSNEFKNLDLTQYKLIHDGQLTLKKNPGVQLHGLLFESMMVLLHKQDDKYVLKYFQNTAASTAETNKLISPITYFEQQILVRQLATDKNTFFLILTKTSQMLELKAPSSSECKTWFKHISDAAEQYKPRSNKNSQEIADDPAAATIPHSNTKESLECTTTDRSSQQSNNSINSSVLAREHSLEKNKNNLLNNNNINNNNNNNNETNKTTKINRDDNENDKTFTDSSSDPRDSIYSNNTNNTRTLMQHCTLLEPSEIQISISPAHTAEPILLPGERLKRLDEKIKRGLAEKQKIICDMFRVPNEHFMAIADIASQPEAPKDSADIALAAYSQVQSLTEILTEYMTCTAEQEISAVSTSVCDKCHRKQQLQAEKNQQISISPNLSSATNTITTATDSTVVQKENSLSKTDSDDTIIQDDGYCEIDEFRLPSIPAGLKHTNNSHSNNTSSSSSNNISSTGALQSELFKRQSTISTDSIPEESEQDILSQQNNDDNLSNNKINVSKVSEENNENKKSSDVINLTLNTAEHIEINDTYDTTVPLNKSNPSALENEENSNRILCGPNRLSHVTSLEPTIPCSILNSFVQALNSQISLLLPKINERDLERENLRKENQHLRELLNAMHERQRVEENKETPEKVKLPDDNNEINLD